MHRRVKAFTKRLLFALDRKRATRFFCARSRAFSHALVKERGLYELNQKLIRRVGHRVLSGPFQGLSLSPMTHEEHVGPYLLGTYESELHPWWKQLFRQRFAQILDVGAKFGYYAIGLAIRFPNSPVIAFDPDSWAQAAVREMSQENGVKHVAVADFCDPSWLRCNLEENALIVSDCEGYEAELLCSRDVPALNSATIVVETHDCLHPGIEDRLRQRFAATHRILSVNTRARDDDRPGLAQLFSLREREQLLNEMRPSQTFLMLVPKS